VGRAVSPKSDPRHFDREEFDRFDREEFDRDLERGVEGEFVQPALFRPDISLGLDGQYWLADEPAYSSLVQGGRATLTRRIGDEASLTLTAGSQYQCTEIAAAALADPDLRIETAPLDLARLGRLAPALADCALAPTLTARLEAARSPHAAF
jgi:hypothetical protein